MGLHFLTWLGERKRQDRNEGANRNFGIEHRPGFGGGSGGVEESDEEEG